MHSSRGTSTWNLRCHLDILCHLTFSSLREENSCDTCFRVCSYMFKWGHFNVRMSVEAPVRAHVRCQMKFMSLIMVSRMTNYGGARGVLEIVCFEADHLSGNCRHVLLHHFLREGCI